MTGEFKLEITQLQYNYLLEMTAARLGNYVAAKNHMEEYYYVVEPLPKSGDFKLENDFQELGSRIREELRNTHLHRLVEQLAASSQVPRVRSQRGRRYPVYIDEPHYTPEMECIWRSGTSAQEWLEHRRTCRRDLLPCLAREKE